MSDDDNKTREFDLNISAIRLVVARVSEAAESYIKTLEEGRDMRSATSPVSEEEGLRHFRDYLRASLKLCGESYALSCSLHAAIVVMDPTRAEKLDEMVFRAHEEAHKNQASEVIKSTGANWPGTVCSNKDLN